MERESLSTVEGLPPDLLRVLRDQSIIVPQDAAVFEAVGRVAQADAMGCGIAVLAMLTGHSYADVQATLDRWSGREQDWSREGCTHYWLDRYLAGLGWFVQRRYEAWPELPVEPFAPIHYASVQQPSNRGHFVVVLANGDVLDPLRKGVYRLSDWPNVNQLVGLVRP